MDNVMTTGQLAKLLCEGDIIEPPRRHEFLFSLARDLHVRHPAIRERFFENGDDEDVVLDILNLWVTGREDATLIELIHRIESRFDIDLLRALRGRNLYETKIIASSKDPHFSEKKGETSGTTPTLLSQADPRTDTNKEEIIEGITSYNFQDKSFITINEENDLTKSFNIKLEKDMLKKSSRGFIHWKQVVGLGRAFRKVSVKLVVSEEILAIMPTTAVIFFSPPRTTDSHQSTEDQYQKMENESLSEMQEAIGIAFPHITTTKLRVLRQLIVYDMNFDILKLIANSENIKCNFVVDNPQKFAKGSTYPDKADPQAAILSANIKEYFQKFAQLRTNVGFWEGVKNWVKRLSGLNQEDTRIVKVALLDTGVNLKNLPNSPNSGCFESDKMNARTDTMAAEKIGFSDDSNNQHGTKVAYMLAGSCHASTEILTVKVLGSDCEGTYHQIAAGLQCALDYGAEIVNCSFNYNGNGEWEKQKWINAMRTLYGNALVVISAGNNNSAPQNLALLPPADLDWVISVGSVTWEGAWSQFSCGKCLANIATFGDNLLISLKNSPESIVSGTSYAAPAVSGLLTHLIAICPSVKNVTTAKWILEQGAEKVKDSETCLLHKQCNKLLNVNSAYQAAKDFAVGINPLPANNQEHVNHIAINMNMREVHQNFF